MLLRVFVTIFIMLWRVRNKDVVAINHATQPCINSSANCCKLSIFMCTFFQHCTRSQS